MEKEREERYNELFLILKDAVHKTLVENLTEEEKDDGTIGALVNMAIIKIAASLAVSLNISHDAFMIGCSELYNATVEDEKEEKANKSIPSGDLN